MGRKQNSLPGVVKLCNRRIAELEAKVQKLTDEGLHVADGLLHMTVRCEALEAENTRIRAALANSKSPCVYCSLPAAEWAKCKSGFPGCARMDDASGCPEFGASAALAEYRAANKRLREALAGVRWVIGLMRSVVLSGETWTDTLNKGYVRACNTIDAALKETADE